MVLHSLSVLQQQQQRQQHKHMLYTQAHTIPKINPSKKPQARPTKPPFNEAAKPGYTVAHCPTKVVPKLHNQADQPKSIILKPVIIPNETPNASTPKRMHLHLPPITHLL